MAKKTSLTEIEKVVNKRKSITANGKGKAVIWTRVSSEEQFKNNNSIDTQLEACRRYCEQINKQVKCEFGGTFESAKKAGERFLEMIGAVMHDSEVDTIVVYDYDRFSRNMEEGLVYKGQLNRSGVSIESVNQPIDKSNSLASHIEAILLIVADIDNATRRSKCYNGMVACINRGEWYSRPPFGYNSKKINKEHKLTVNEQGRILKNAWEWIAAEPNISQAQIIKRLRTYGLEISKQKLSDCLQNPFYCGKIQHKYLYGKTIFGRQEALVSVGLFDRVQDILRGNHKGYVHIEQTPQFPLKGHIYFNGHMLTGYTVKKKNLDYYKYSGKDGTVNVSAKELHNKYSDLLDEFRIPQNLIPILTNVLKQKFEEKEKVQADEIRSIDKNLATIASHIKTVKKNFAVGKIEEDVYNEVIRDLEQDKRDAEAARERASVNLSNLASYIDEAIAITCNLSTYWKNGDFELCQNIQNLIFPDGVKWDKENREYLTNNTNSFFDVMRSVSAV